MRSSTPNLISKKKSRTRALSVWMLALIGCGAPLLDSSWEGGTYLTVSGPVDPDVPLQGGELRAAIAWVWMADGELGSVVVDAPFEPRVYQYSVEIDRPPDRSGSPVPIPIDLPPSARVLLGTAVLYETASGGELELQADPSDLLDALLSPGFPGGVVRGTGATVVAAWPEHRLGVLATDSGAQRLLEVPEWSSTGPLVQISELSVGLTLYRSSTSEGGWEPVAPAGQRTEFQSVGMGPVGG